MRKGILAGAAVAAALSLAGCIGDNDGAGPPARLVSVDTYNPDNGLVFRAVRVSYEGGAAVLRPYGSDGQPLENGYRLECRFAPAGPQAYPAVTEHRLMYGISGSLTGQLMLSIFGLVPAPAAGCQEFFPDRPLASELLTTPAMDAEGHIVERIDVVRAADGHLTQRYSGHLVATLVAVSGFTSYDEHVRYVSEGDRTTGMVYAMESYPEGGYTSWDGNIVYDMFLFGALRGLIYTEDGLYVSPAAGYAQRYEYDDQGRLAAIRTYEGRGSDGQWLTDDDVAAADGLTRYTWENGRLATIETGLRPVDEQPADNYRVQRFRYQGGALAQKRVYDVSERLIEVWQYARTMNFQGGTP